MIPRVPHLSIGLAAVVLCACVAAPKGEYRNGLYLHSTPRYSFRVPEGWRPASVEDGASIAWVAHSLRFLDEEGKRRGLEEVRQLLLKQDAILISAVGAGIVVENARAAFRGISIPRGTLPESDRKAFVDALVGKRPRASVESLELLVDSVTPGLRARVEEVGRSFTWPDGPTFVALVPIRWRTLGRGVSRRSVMPVGLAVSRIQRGNRDGSGSPGHHH